VAITVANVRTAIGDRPQLWPAPGSPPELMGQADGVRTIFSIRYENYIDGTLTVYEATAPPSSSGETAVWTAVDPSLYVVGSTPNPTSTGATNAIITFNAAPDAGTFIGGGYQVTAFSDDDLNGYLTRAQALYSDDASVLKRAQFDIIDALLMDYNRLYLLAQGEYRTDPASYAASLKQLKAELRKDLTGDPVPGSSSPAMLIGNVVTRRYQPFR
jgi:hypothetical protein